MCRCQRWVTPDTLLQVEISRPPPARISRPRADIHPNREPILPRADTTPLSPERFPPEQGTLLRPADTLLRPGDTLLRPGDTLLRPAVTQLPQEEASRPRQEVTPPPSPGPTQTCPLQVSAVSLSSACRNIMGLLLVIACVPIDGCSDVINGLHNWPQLQKNWVLMGCIGN